MVGFKYSYVQNWTLINTYVIVQKHTHSSFGSDSMSSNLQAAARDNDAFGNDRFLIGREKPGMQSEVARLISETLEQEKSQQQQQHLDEHYEHSTEEVGRPGTQRKQTIVIFHFVSTFYIHSCVLCVSGFTDKPDISEENQLKTKKMST